LAIGQRVLQPRSGDIEPRDDGAHRNPSPNPCRRFAAEKIGFAGLITWG
jgi:hypothetical protein